MKKIIFLLFALYAISAYAGSLKPYYYSDYYPNGMEYTGRYLCIISEEGMTYYDELRDEIWFTENTYYHTSDTITCVAVDKNDGRWFGTFGDGVYKEERQGVATSRHNYYWNNGFPLVCYSIAFDSECNPWLAGIHFYVDYNKDKVYRGASPTHCSEHMIDRIMDMEFDSKNNLWMAIDHVEHYYLTCHKKGDSSPTPILEGTAATSLAIDSKDNIWLTCTNGIHYYEPETKKNTLYNHENHPEIPKALYTACDIDQDGNVWFISSKLLLKYDGKSFTQHTCEGFDEARSVLCGRGNVWVYTKNHILLRFKNNTFTSIDLNSQGTGLMKEKSESPLFTATYNTDGTVTITGDIAINGVEVYDISGKLISITAGKGEKRVQIKGSGMPGKDLYLIKVKHAQGESVVKMIK